MLTLYSQIRVFLHDGLFELYCIKLIKLKPNSEANRSETTVAGVIWRSSQSYHKPRDAPCFLYTFNATDALANNDKINIATLDTNLNGIAGHTTCKTKAIEHHRNFLSTFTNVHQDQPLLFRRRFCASFAFRKGGRYKNCCAILNLKILQTALAKPRIPRPYAMSSTYSWPRSVLFAALPETSCWVCVYSL